VHSVKKDLNKLFTKYSSLKSQVYNLVTIGSSLKLSPDEMNEIQEMKREVDDWQKMLNQINNELNELSRRHACICFKGICR
jgi:hypothetical protein